MCELFGFTSENKRDLRGYLREFYSHSVRHPHGWGLVSYKENKLNIATEPGSAVESAALKDMIESLPPQNSLIGHIRFATVGALEKANCHPFVREDITGREWILAHNGTIFNGMTLLKYTYLQQGSTDSERILMYFVDKINEKIRQKGETLNGQERFEVIDSALADITKRNKVNLILYDTEQFYVHSNMRGTLYYKKDNGAYTFATVPLDAKGWRPMPLCTLQGYKNGRRLYKGNNHNNIYVESISLIANDTEFNL